MPDGPDARYFPPPPDARCERCGGGDDLGAIVAYTFDEQGSREELAGWICRACGNRQARERTAQAIAWHEQRLAAAADPISRHDILRGVRSYAAQLRQHTPGWGLEPWPELTAFLERFDPTHEDPQTLGARPATMLPAPVSGPELRAAFVRQGTPEEAVDGLVDDLANQMHAGEPPAGWFAKVILTAALESPAHERRVRDWLRVQHGWDDARFDESLAWVRERLARDEGTSER